MFKVLSYLVIFVCIGLGFSWFATHYSEPLVLHIAHMRIATTLPVALGVFLLAAVLLWLVIYIVQAILSLPAQGYRHFRSWQKSTQQDLLSQSVAALLAGDQSSLRLLSQRLKQGNKEEKNPLIPFIQAQALLAQNDPSGALQLYQNMRQDSKSKILGLFGLYQEAMKTGAVESALIYAKEAFNLTPFLPWANQAILGDLVYKKSWDKAQQVLRMIERATPRIERKSQNFAQKEATLFLAQALDLEENHPAEARALALKAQKMAPDFVPATSIAARLLYKFHEGRRASKMVENLWKKCAHPDLARVYLLGAEEQTSQERLNRMEKLAQYNAQAYESLLCIAGCAFSAGQYRYAKEKTEEALKKEPRESGFALLAKIQQRLALAQEAAHPLFVHEQEETPSFRHGSEAAPVLDAAGAQHAARSAEQTRESAFMEDDVLSLTAEPHTVFAQPASMNADCFWIGDERILSEWAPISPVKRLFDAVEWRAPVARVDGRLKKETFLSLAEGIEDLPLQQKAKEASSFLTHNLVEEDAKDTAPEIKPQPEESKGPQEKPFSPYGLHEGWHRHAQEEKKDAFSHFTVDDPGVSES